MTSFYYVFNSQDSKIKTTSTYFVQKDKTKVIQTTANKNDMTRASLKSNKSKIEQEHFTKIMEQNGALPRSNKANEASIKSLSLARGYLSSSVNNNNAVNDLKPPAPAYWDGKKKSSFVNGYRCDVLPDNNAITVIEEDDLIPPTPSPVGQHSVMNCRAQLCPSLTNKMTVANEVSARNYYTSGQRGTEEVAMDSTDLQRCDLAVTDADKGSVVSDLVLPSCNSLGTESTTCSTSRKKYKLARKGKLPKVLSSPLKKTNHMCGSTAKSPKCERNLKGIQVTDQKGSTPVIAPSKCVVLRSRMKRSAAKGSSPLQKRLQTELPLRAKVLLEWVKYRFAFFSGIENVMWSARLDTSFKLVQCRQNNKFESGNCSY